ncbi:excinuclease ABC subunit UvrB [Candidatus Falkowbacteria bacterium]|nr:excinuclease ABC subunit UvrB [Candidatus Falkowbacteria bacterium]
MLFKVVSPFQPAGDQPEAITALTGGFAKYPQQTLLGVTGSGKTFTAANVIARLNKPTLVLSHNKTLAAQLYNEFREFFPENKVCYFVSYYDYYQPESYLPITDTYIEKDMKINEKIEQLRLEATAALMSRDDVIVVSSVSCIYGLGKPDNFKSSAVEIKVGSKISPEEFVSKLVDIQYENSDLELHPGNFRLRGSTVELIEGAGTTVLRIEFDEKKIAKISELHPITFNKTGDISDVYIFPARHFVFDAGSTQKALKTIRAELQERLPQLDDIKAYRLEKRTNYDLEMIEQLGHCKGIENYSRHFDGRRPGEQPYTLIDYFKAKGDWLLLIDESHVSLPQVQGMYGGDRSRKDNLIEHGFRLPSAYDNRPLTFTEFEKYLNHVIYISATPSEYEREHSGQIVEQIIRPTGLVDPPITVKPAEGQVKDVEREIRKTVEQGYRVLVTTLTKRLAEDLTSYLVEQNIKAKYLHSEIDTMERTRLIQDLRLGKFDVLVGINLLREGLDIPEVALVAILDADKEGFLRNERSLIQTIGRAARNVDSRVIMYADTYTRSIKAAIKETDRRRMRQEQYNTEHGITPESITKAIIVREDVILPELKGQALDAEKVLVELELQMQAAAESLDFERAIMLRDKIKELKEK